jgi:hypothetical protein
MWVYLPFVLLLMALGVRGVHGIWQAVRGVGLEALGQAPASAEVQP